MITDLSLTLEDFNFNFDKLRFLFNKESDIVKAEFLSNKLIDLLKFQDYVKNNNDKYCTFISDISSYEIFHVNVLSGINSNNSKIESIYNQYAKLMKIIDPAPSASLYVIVHALVNNPLRYWDHSSKKITYNEIDLYKRLLVLNGFGLLSRNKFSLSLLNLLTDHYGIIQISNQDISDLKSDLTRDTAVA